MPATGAYFVGQQVLLTATFRNAAEELVNPTAVTFEVLNGELELERYLSPTHVSTGIWTQVITLAKPGTWRYRGVGTGAVVAAAWNTFGVEPEAFLNRE